ncbi:MAG: hypothetical protein ACRCUP_07150 [Mycoplasmatales bacterium]
MKKIVISGLISLFILSFVTVVSANVLVDNQQKKIAKIVEMNDNFQTAKFMDFKQTAIDFQQNYVEKTSSFTTPAYNLLDTDLKVLMSYVDGNQANYSQEAITNISSLISAELVGEDTDMNIALDFYNTRNDEQIVLNNPNGKSGSTFWYETWPNILFLEYAQLKKTSELDQVSRQIYEQYLSLVDKISGGTKIVNLDKATAYSFAEQKLTRNNQWVEPDAASAIALILDKAYEQTKELKYLEAAKTCLSYLNQLDYNPKYELLGAIGPVLASKYNAIHGTNFDTSKFLLWEFDTASDVRSDWTMLSGNFNGLDIDGTIGSQSDYGGYAFSMNTFVEGISLSSLAKYDFRYKDMLAKFLANNYASLTNFYAGQLEPTHYSKPGVYSQEKYVPYEGIKESFKGISPYVAGDPLEYEWANSDLSLYGGSYAGMYAQILVETNNPQVLVFDLNQADLTINKHQQPLTENYLIYNPTSSTQILTLQTNKQVYNIDEQQITNSQISIPAKASQQISLIEDPTKLKVENQNIWYGQQLLASKPEFVEITNLENNQVVDKRFMLNLQTSNPNSKMRLLLNGQQVMTGSFQPEFEFLNQQNLTGEVYLTIEVEINERLYYDTKKIIILDQQLPKIFELESTSNLEPIAFMPGTYENSVVKEANVDPWGGVQTQEIRVDARKSYRINIDTSEINGKWSLQLHAPNDPNNQYGYYVQGDTKTTGIKTFVIDQLIEKMPVDEAGFVNFQIWLVASGIDDASFKVNKLELIENQLPNLEITNKISFTNRDFEKILRSNQQVDYVYGQGIIGLINRADTGYKIKLPTYIAKEKTKVNLDFATTEYLKVVITNERTGTSIVVPKTQFLVQDYEVLANDKFTISLEITSPKDEVQIINELTIE